ncbi:retrovirus-related Pol polyprotein from transposon 297 [Trichonephila clavipes]|nr:retrovirus-related Pol polyprotein from transposon 297 [Trichonephila clavipes]
MQSINEVPIKLSAICISPVEPPYVLILLNETFTKAFWDTEAEKLFISEETYRKYFYKQVKKSRTQVIKAQGAKCQSIGIVELNVRIREFEKPWLFRVLANLEYPYKPGLTHVLYHEIDTEDNPPVDSRPYRYDRVKQEIIDYHVDKMLKEGTIIPVQSPFDVDYRKVNAITKYSRYPLPLIDDLIMNIPHTEIISALDLSSGYFQLAINPSDIIKTAFVRKNGTYAFRRMLFGLSGPAPNFQKAIDIILKPVIGKLVKAQKAFDVVKAAITKAPVLKLLDFKKAFELFTDASSIGVGAVVNQEQTLVVFASRTLSSADREGMFSSGLGSE